MTERIEGAAVMYDDGARFLALAPPARHVDVIIALAESGVRSRQTVQGFITSRGRFVDRREAWPIARDAGQLLKTAGKDKPGQMLFSEDVW